MFKGQLEMSDLGYIKVNERMETNVPGVFAAGEAADPHFRQVVTSAGMGAAAAIQATRFLEAESGYERWKEAMTGQFLVKSGEVPLFFSKSGKIKSDKCTFFRSFR